MRYLLAVALIAVFLVPEAQAQAPPCSTRSEVASALEKGYGEYATAMGLSSDGNVLELFVTPDGSTWTMVVTFPNNGMSCPVSAGKAWGKVKPKAKKMGLRI